MDSYQVLVIALLILAVADLMVGVSNDAVNFLNSAIGSRVASRNVILGIAAAGVFVGAASSSGMMEVARKGIFLPSYFSFADVMVIFMAVMITDILLLDLYNSLGLPTSTTVSIVFELLGASVMTGWLMLGRGGSEASSVLQLINSDKAVQIIMGIFLSVAVAFSVGAIVQWLTRLWFTFNYHRRLARYGVPFAGIAITIIVYFLLVKGMKGAEFGGSFGAALQWMEQNVWLFLLITLGVASILLLVLVKFARLHPLKLVVLAGTFALAMAFAGNDLVNFIGVPITGWQSFQLWQDSGLEAQQYMMDSLAEAVRTPKLMLFIAGIIMVITLWISAKAHRVTETEVKLGSQGAVSERFKPNALSRGIVSAANSFGNFFTTIIPDKTVDAINHRFKTQEIEEDDQPAFDLVRASVNLVLASILIAFASSLKLPLSTTYVSFMVAMGSSLADRAWGAESAPHRVAGVLNVIGGWFLTAIGAFTAAALVALAIYYGGNWVAVALFVIAFVVLIKSNIPVKEQVKKEVKKKI